MIERDQKMRIQFSVAIGLCRRDLDLDRPPSPQALKEWVRLNVPDLFPEEITLAQARHMLAHPEECFA